MRQNVAGQFVSFGMNSATDGSAVTSGTPTVYVTINGGTQSTGGGTSTHEGNGQWSYAATQAETNGIQVAWTMAISGAISQTVNTYPVNYDTTDSALGLNDLSAAQVNAECDTALADYDGPTNAEMVARTLLAADYFDPATDTVANVTTVGTTTTNTDMRGTDSAATAAALAVVDSNVDAILVDTGTSIPATLTNIEADTTLIPSLNDISTAQVKTQVVDGLSVDTYAEPGQGTPPATGSLATKIGYIYKIKRNKTEQTATQWSLYGDDTVTIDQRATVSDDGTTSAKQELVSGP